MKAAAGTTSNSARSNGARESDAVALMPRASRYRGFARVDQRALHRHVHAQVVAHCDVAAGAHVQRRARGRYEVEQRVAAAVLDVVDAPDDGIHAVRAVTDHDLLRANRYTGVTAVERLLAHTGEVDVTAAEHHTPILLTLDRELEHVAVAHEACHMKVRRLGVDFLRRRDLLHDAVLH